MTQHHQPSNHYPVKHKGAVLIIGKAVISSLIILLLCVANGYGYNPEECHIYDINKSAYIISKGSRTKREAKKGEKIHYGDSVQVLRGNFVRIAFDARGEDIIHLDGDALVRVSNGFVVHLNLEKGKMVALLDNKFARGGFVVSTSQAVASAKGTYFQMATDGHEESRARLYRGSAEVVGLDRRGAITSGEMLVSGAETNIKDYDRIPSKPNLMTRNAFEEINNIVSTLENKRDYLSFDEAAMDFKQYVKKSQKKVDVDKSTQDTIAARAVSTSSDKNVGSKRQDPYRDQGSINDQGYAVF